MIQELDHIGIAVTSLEEGIAHYSSQLGLRHEHTEEVPSEKVRVAMLLAGQTRIELLEPTSEDSVIAQFLKKRKGGVHHLALRVDNIAKEVDRLRKQQVQFIEPAPRPGAQNSKIAFIHPKSTGGTLIELVERSS